MKYLIFASAAAATARSEAAYVPLRSAEEPEGPVTVSLWPARHHPTDGRAALTIPDTPEAAGLGIDQAAYDGLLTDVERAALADELTSDWRAGP